MSTEVTKESIEATVVEVTTGQSRATGRRYLQFTFKDDAKKKVWWRIGFPLLDDRFSDEEQQREEQIGIFAIRQLKKLRIGFVPSIHDTFEVNLDPVYLTRIFAGTRFKLHGCYEQYRPLGLTTFVVRDAERIPS